MPPNIEIQQPHNEDEKNDENKATELSLGNTIKSNFGRVGNVFSSVEEEIMNIGENIEEQVSKVGTETVVKGAITEYKVAAFALIDGLSDFEKELRKFVNKPDNQKFISSIKSDIDFILLKIQKLVLMLKENKTERKENIEILKDLINDIVKLFLAPLLIFNRELFVGFFTIFLKMFNEYINIHDDNTILKNMIEDYKIIKNNGLITNGDNQEVIKNIGNIISNTALLNDKKVERKIEEIDGGGSGKKKNLNSTNSSMKIGKNIKKSIRDFLNSKSFSFSKKNVYSSKKKGSKKINYLKRKKHYNKKTNKKR